MITINPLSNNPRAVHLDELGTNAEDLVAGSRTFDYITESASHTADGRIVFNPK
jgi:phosphoenolpyruvate synthase/pyruvate phosphate dikinase